ncbi:MAG: hypothetical protein ABIN80_28525 [Dyadobacter sp.]|uniref:hypothetical protein n=1 Tax=Dyadobacter sp. TaxID=1914288 RepID=UPI003263876D
MQKKWIILLIFLVPFISKAQQAGVDSLLKILPTLKGRLRIDCLNEIGEHCLWTRSDSVAWYAQKALQEASAIHYQKGIDIAWFSIGTTKIVNLQNVEAERLMRRSLAAFEGVDAYHTGVGQAIFSRFVIPPMQIRFCHHITGSFHSYTSYP